MRYDGITCHVPVTAPNLGGTGSGSGAAVTSPNGRYRVQMQDDGNLVVYRDGNVPVWSWMTGAL